LQRDQTIAIVLRRRHGEIVSLNHEDEAVMTDRSYLISQADDLRRQAEKESDQDLRDRLLRMADRYVHLADSQTQSEAHPADVASLSELFTKRE
jgi:hypothetical protein